MAAAPVRDAKAQAAGVDQQGMAFYHAGSLPQAVAAFDRACRLDRTNAAYQSHLALTLIGERQNGLLVTKFRSLAALAPAEPSTHFWLARGLSLTRQPAEAEYRAAVRLAPGRWLFHYYLAATFRAEGKADAAAQEQRVTDRLRRDEPRETP